MSWCSWSSSGGSDAETQAIASAFGVTPAALIGGTMPAPVLTLLTYMFIHADLGHIFGNMIFCGCSAMMSRRRSAAVVFSSSTCSAASSAHSPSWPAIRHSRGR